MYWPHALSERLLELASERGMTLTQIVVRVLAHADDQRVLEDWITKPPPLNNVGRKLAEGHG